MAHAVVLAQNELLPADAIIVRGGESSPRSMKKSALRHYRICLDEDRWPPEYALSVEYRIGCTAEEIAIQSEDPYLHKYRQMRQCTVAEILGLGLGYEVAHDGRPGHALIKLHCYPTDDRIAAVDFALAPAEDNPGFGGRV